MNTQSERAKQSRKCKNTDAVSTRQAELYLLLSFSVVVLSNFGKAGQIGLILIPSDSGAEGTSVGVGV